MIASLIGDQCRFLNAFMSNYQISDPILPFSILILPPALNIKCSGDIIGNKAKKANKLFGKTGPFLNSVRDKQESEPFFEKFDFQSSRMMKRFICQHNATSFNKSGH
jgi:hypothetical protein